MNEKAYKPTAKVTRTDSSKLDVTYECPNCGYVSFRILKCPVCGEMLVVKNRTHSKQAHYPF